MATTIKPFPHYQINVKDNSIYEVEYTTILPVHRPIWIMRCQQGPVGDPVWCPTYTYASNMFGEQTFTNTNKKYYSPQAKVLTDTLTYNGAFICRAADETALNSVVIIEAYVRQVDDILQYAYDEDGNRLLDDDGNYVEKKENGEPVYEPGVEIKFVKRHELLSSEEVSGYDYSSLQRRVVTDTDAEGTEIIWSVYPIMVFEALYPGEYGNDLCFSLFYKNSENAAGDVNFYQTLFYTFAPARREYDSTTVTPHYDIYNTTQNSFAANPETLNPDTGAEMSMQAVLNKAYDEDSHQLPYTIYTYEENLLAVGNRIAQVESETSLGHTKPTYDAEAIMNTTFGYLVNVISCRNLNGVPYDHVRLITISDEDENVIQLAEDNYIYLAGGTDGDLSDLMVQNCIQQFCAKTLNPQIVDKFRYPFTHMYDVGYNFDTKYAMIDFLDVRDDIMIELSTQVLMDDNTGRTITLNDQMTDESNGEALRSRALLMRESVLKGTDCCRCAIYAHAGFLADGVYSDPMPFTYWSAMKHARFGNLPYMNTTEPRGWPQSYNEFFKVSSVNWINYDPEGQSRVWDSGINYVQWADMTRIFYPALRTVYRAETSVLVDQWFVDAVVYTKHVVRNAWGKFSGRNDKSAVLQQGIKEYLDTELSYLYNGKYDFEVSVYQTAEEQRIGYIQHVLIRLTSPATMRVLDVDIEVNREGYESEESEAAA